MRTTAIVVVGLLLVLASAASAQEVLVKDVKVGMIKLTGIAEAFNVFNHANYGQYNGQISTATFGRPRQNAVNSYFPRTAQFAFRIGF